MSTIRLEDISGLILMGGALSANDTQPWIGEELKYIQQAFALDMPIMGVCFGAQMISKALGGEVYVSPSMETGWHHIHVDKRHLSQTLADQVPDSFDVFQWHEETFTNPEGAIPVFTGSNICNQGYILGKVLTMQFHLEMTEHMVQDWLRRYNNCLPMHLSSVQSPHKMTENLHERLEKMHSTADKVYDWWLGMIVG